MTPSSKTSTYEIIRVGLPITRETITQEFLDIVDELERNEHWVGLTLCDYDTTGTKTRLDQHNAPAGYEVLLERGFVFQQKELTRVDKIIGTFGYLWLGRNPIQTTIKMLQILKNTHATEQFKTVVTFTPGSPYYDDAITKILSSAFTDIRIVDTQSSAQIAANAIGEDYEIRAYYDDFVLGKNTAIDKSKVAIFSCLQHGYNVDMHKVITDLQPKKIIAVNIKLDKVEKQVYTYDEVLNNIDTLFRSEQTYIFGFVW
jgi:hypothetical protein